MAHSEGAGWKGASGCWAVMLSHLFFVGSASYQGAFTYVRLGRVSLCSGPQSRSQSTLRFPATTGTSWGAGSCQVGVSSTAACISWAWAPSRQGCSRYCCGKESRASPCPWGHLALQPQPFPFLHFLNLKQKSSFLPFLSHSTLEFCCLMHTGPASGYS